VNIHDYSCLVFNCDRKVNLVVDGQVTPLQIENDTYTDYKYCFYLNRAFECAKSNVPVTVSNQNGMIEKGMLRNFLLINCNLCAVEAGVAGVAAAFPTKDFAG